METTHNKKYKLVIWDVDGTILDTSVGLLESVRYLVKETGLKMPDEETLRSCVGPRIQDSLNRVYGLTGDKLKELSDMYREHYKEYDVLMDLFSQFKAHTSKVFIANQSHPMSKQLSVNAKNDFGTDNDEAGYNGTEFKQEGFSISFKCNGTPFSIPVIGRHNMENALAATAICSAIGIPVKDSAKALDNYRGIYRRTQLAGEANGCCVIDDFAHNPAEVVCAIKACQTIGKRVWAWFQPHGFGPLKFMHEELETEVLKVLRKDDYFLLSDVYYAGGTVERTVTSSDVADRMKFENGHVLYFGNRDLMPPYIKMNIQPGDVILTMGARDNSLSDFAKKIFDEVVK